MDKIETRPLKPTQDLLEMNEWLTARGKAPVSLSGIPELGLMAENSQGPIAAAFIRRCEGNVGMIDGLVTNPKASSLDRHQAIDLVVQRLLAIAKTLELTRVLAFSTDEGTLRRSEKHGFRKTNYIVISQSL